MEHFWAEYFSVLSDPAHVAAEATFIFIESVLIGSLLWPLAKRWVRRHDEKHHGKDHAHE